jgi:hypothetical protein
MGEHSLIAPFKNTGKTKDVAMKQCWLTLAKKCVSLTWVFLGHDAELVEVQVVPDLLHVVPVCHDSVLDRIPLAMGQSVRSDSLVRAGNRASHQVAEMARAAV